MTDQFIKNPYAPHCFSLVEEILAGDRALRSYLGDYSRYPLRHGRRIRVSKFTKAVMFELCCRSLHALRCHKIEILKAACYVKARWPNVPISEPITNNSVTGNAELLVNLKTTLGRLEIQKVEIEQNIDNHLKAIAALLKKSRQRSSGR